MMTKEQVLAALEADVKKKERSATIPAIIITFVSWAIALAIYLNAPNVWSYYLMAGIMLGLPVVALLHYHLKLKPANVIISRSILEAVYTNTSKIVWIYEKKTTNNGMVSYSIIICDDERHCYETSDVKSAAIQTELLKSVIAVCPNVVSGFRADWNPLYYRDPANFRNSVIAYEKQFKR